MHDIKAIRERPAAFDAGWAKRGLAPQTAMLLALDEDRRSAITALQEALAERNNASREIGAAKARGDEAAAAEKMQAVADLKQRIPALEQQERDAETALNALLQTLPNIPDPSVPDGVDEQDNVEIGSWGTLPNFAFQPVDHVDLGASLGLDFEAAARIAGTRFAVLRGGIARLHRALGQFMLDTQIADFGYREVAPPLLVRDETLFGTGQLPKFADDLFHTTDGRWLIPTAEVSLTNLVREAILDAAVLPLRFVALTPCFRSEAGAAGRDTRGLIRQHQFDKVELVSIVAPDASEAEHERMTGAAEAILRKLDLPYRKLLLCGGDMGFQAVKTYDLEVWMPAQGAYREISSCSNCGDFQARRMDARFRGPDGAIHFVHTLNGSGLAVGRALVAVLENYQRADGSVRIPDALLPYMGGIAELVPE